jgi:hypothetical protein
MCNHIDIPRRCRDGNSLFGKVFAFAVYRILVMYSAEFHFSTRNVQSSFTRVWSTQLLC